MKTNPLMYQGFGKGFFPRLTSSLLVLFLLATPLTNIFAQESAPTPSAAEAVQVKIDSNNLAEDKLTIDKSTEAVPAEDKALADDHFEGNIINDRKLTEETVSTNEALEDENFGEVPPSESLLTVDGGTGNDGRLTHQNLKRMATVDSNTGSLNYSYTIEVPPGRNNLQPDISLVYNSDQKTNDSYIGYGWGINIPYISRVNKTGSERIYIDDNFISSLSGELVQDSGTSYASKVDNGEFFNYQYDNDYWTVTDKNGTVYKFGETASSRQDDPNDSTRIYKWMLEEIRDTNDNYIAYTYSKDAGQIYPEKIVYTGNGTTDGIFEVDFHLQSENMSPTLYLTDFAVKTNYKILYIEILKDTEWVRKYDLTYTFGDAGYRKLLETITETGRNIDTNLQTILNPTTFTYDIGGSMDWNQETTYWQLPLPFHNNYSTDHSTFIQLRDVNGDSYPDIIYNDDDHTQETYINDTLGTGWISSYPTWDIPVLLADDDDTYEDYGTRSFDYNGDYLNDLVRSYADNEGPSPSNLTFNVWKNNSYSSPGWSTVTSTDVPIGFVYGNNAHADGATQIVDFNGDGLSDIVYGWADDDGAGFLEETYTGDGEGVWTTTTDPDQWVLPYHIIDENDQGSEIFSYAAIADFNGDNLADVLWSKNAGTNTSDEGAYINNGHNWNAEDDDKWVLNFKLQQTTNLQLDISDAGTRMTDLNGDGIMDFYKAREISSSTLSCQGYLNTLNEDSQFSSTQNLSFQEVGVGCYEPFAQSNGYSMPSVVLADINADGMDDIIFAQIQDTTGIFEQRIYLSIGTPFTDMLTNIKNPQGGETEISYKQSTKYFDSNDNLLNPELPFLVVTVGSITTNDGLGNSSIETYSYADGHYYYNNPQNRKFSGFGVVTKTDPELNVTKTYFHQGDPLNTSNVAIGDIDDSEWKIGKPYRVEKYDASGNYYEVTVSKWGEDMIGTSDAKFVHQDAATTFSYNGDTNHRDTMEEFTYDTDNGNLLTHTEWGEVTAHDDGTLDTNIGTDERITEYEYAVPVGSTNVMGLPSHETVTDTNGNSIKETKYYYDNFNTSLGDVDLGNLTLTERSVDGSVWSANLQVYNAFGLVESSWDPESNITNYSYDSYNLYPEVITDALSLNVTHTYDYETGKVINTTDKNSNVWTTTYDGLGRPLTEVIPTNGGQVTKTDYVYDDTSFPNSIEKTDHLSSLLSRKRFTYLDGLGRTIQTRSEAENRYDVVEISYDGMGRVVSQSLPFNDAANGSAFVPPSNAPSGVVTSYRYDPLSRISRAGTANLGDTSYDYSTDWQTTVTDSNGHDKTYYSDAYGNLIQVDEVNGVSTYNTYYEWNLANSLTKVTDAEGNERNFTYDYLGRRLSSEDLHDTSDTSFGTWNYVYDLAGNLTQTTDPRGNVIDYTYDDLNRVLTEDDASVAGPPTIGYVYDTTCQNGIGRLCLVTNTVNGVSTGYRYTEKGEVSDETVTIVTPQDHTAYTYDYQSNLTKIVYPDAATVGYKYNAAGRVETVTYTPSGGSAAWILSNVDYHSTGGVAREDYGNGVFTKNTYDDTTMYRLGGKITSDSSTNMYQDIAYTYDNIGNIIQINDNSNSDAVKKAIYSYDDLDRLTDATIDHTPNANGANDYTDTYRYSAIGDLTYYNSNAYTYAGNTISGSYANPHAVTDINTTTTYSYDHSGNLTNDSTNTYLWNYRNELSKVTTPSVSIFYTYDHTGNRVQSTDGTTTTDVPNKYYETDLTNGIDYIYANNQLVATVDTNGTHYVHADHLTGSNVITDSFPKQEELLDYYPFGDIRLNEQMTTLDLKKKFTGHQYDADTDLLYMGARYYQAKRGQFLSEDPMFLGIGAGNPMKLLMDPQALNSYSYSRNNPLCYIDPDGRTFLEMVGNTVSSLGTNIVDAAAGMVNAVFHPIETGKALSRSISNLPQTISNLPSNAKEFYNNFQNASDSEKGQMLGSGLFFVGSIALPELRVGSLSEGALVCRGGLCTADRFVSGAEKIGADGKLYGISVNAGDASISDLTKSLPQNKVGVGAMEKIKSMGGEFVSMPKSGNPYYGQLNGLTGEQLESVFGKNIISNPNK